jgi:ABC-type sugar transport system ATPase subunit
MLTCKGVDFSYGQLQVLFDVDFTVDDGEMVALLGTNGAGKSTLLKVISGIGLPQSGTIRYRGQDITYLDAERRARLGITQVPGGRAVFGPLTVVENLRAYGYAIGKERKHLDGLIDECFEAFPRLHERATASPRSCRAASSRCWAVQGADHEAPAAGHRRALPRTGTDHRRPAAGDGPPHQRHGYRRRARRAVGEHRAQPGRPRLLHGEGRDALRRPGLRAAERDDLLRAVFLEGTDAAT